MYKGKMTCFQIAAKVIRLAMDSGATELLVYRFPMWTPPAVKGLSSIYPHVAPIGRVIDISA